MRVIAVDGGDGKKDLCMRLGAEHFMTIPRPMTSRSAPKLTGLGAHEVIDKPY